MSRILGSWDLDAGNMFTPRGPLTKIMQSTEWLFHVPLKYLQKARHVTPTYRIHKCQDCLDISAHEILIGDSECSSNCVSCYFVRSWSISFPENVSFRWVNLGLRNMNVPTFKLLVHFQRRINGIQQSVDLTDAFFLDHRHCTLNQNANKSIIKQNLHFTRTGRFVVVDVVVANLTDDAIPPRLTQKITMNGVVRVEWRELNDFMKLGKRRAKI